MAEEPTLPTEPFAVFRPETPRRRISPPSLSPDARLVFLWMCGTIMGVSSIYAAILLITGDEQAAAVAAVAAAVAAVAADHGIRPFLVVSWMLIIFVLILAVLASQSAVFALVITVLAAFTALVIWRLPIEPDPSSAAT